MGRYYHGSTGTGVLSVGEGLGESQARLVSVFRISGTTDEVISDGG
jgi:hypothetical protein